MKKSWLFGIIAAVVVVVVAAGGYYLFFQKQVQSQVEVQLRQFFANPPPPYTKATYEKLDVALASRKLTIDNIVLERSVAPYTIKIGRLEATGVDTDNLQNIFDSSKYKDGASDQTMRKLADTLTLTKVEGDSRDNGRVAIEQFVAKGIQGRQFTVKPEPATIASMSETDRTVMVLSALHIDSMSYDKAVISNPTSSGTIGHMEFADFSREHLGSMAMDDVDMTNKKDDSRTTIKHFDISDIPTGVWFDYASTGKPPADVMQLLSLGGMKITEMKVAPGKGNDKSFHIASLTVGKVSRRRLEKFSLSGVDYSEKGNGVSIGAIEIEGLDWEHLLPLAGDSNWISKLGDISYSVDKFSLRDIGGSSLDAAGAKLHGMTLAISANTDTGKQSSSMTIDRFEVDVAKLKNPQAAGFLRALGYDNLNLSMEMVGTGDSKAGTSAFDKFRIFGPQLGELSLNLAISDYHKAPATKKPPTIDDAIEPIMATKLQNLKLSWHDDGLTPRLLKFAGTQSGATAEQMRDALIAQIKGFGAAYESAPPVAAAVQALVDYLNKPGTLTIAATPPVPPRIGELAPLLNGPEPPNVPEIFRVLGLTVTAN